MAFNLSTFKTGALPQGGFRPTLFEIRETTRLGTGAGLLCQAAQVPAQTMGVVEVPYFGRKIKLAGDRTYAEWTTTFMVDESFDVRRQLEDWNLAMNSAEENLRAEIATAYKEDVQVLLYGKQGSVIREYNLIGCWPADVSTIELDWNQAGTISTYSVTWAFDYMDVGS